MALIDISHLTFAHEGELRPLFNDFSLCLDTGWKLALIGRNGRGKTTLLHLLAGRLPYAGSISLPSPVHRFPPDIPDPDLPAPDLIRRLAPDLEPWRWKRELALLGVSEAESTAWEGRPFSGLSGGERTKALLAALFAREAGFPLIDELVNHLDATGRAAPTLVFVEHDRAFTERIATDRLEW